MQAELKQLIARKDNLEKELANLSAKIAILDETKSFNKGLVDAEGFPRSDLDFGELSNYRNLKRKFAELNNDHLALMKEIETKLFALHASYVPVKEDWPKQTTQPKTKIPNMEKKQEKVYVEKGKEGSKIDYLTPFAKIGLVQASSPAKRGGVRVGDLVSEFDEINIYSLDWLKQIAQTVKEGKQLRIVVLRRVDSEQQKLTNVPIYQLKDENNYYKLQLTITPAKWSGRGLLGCKIDPL